VPPDFRRALAEQSFEPDPATDRPAAKPREMARG